jgi:hypothetical protein
MLRIILRNTHNALLFACTLLLLCSLERLWRYDFARGETDQHPAVGLQVDHFVFWGGVPAWEFEAKNNPVSSGLFKFMTFSSNSWARTKTSSVATNTRTDRPGIHTEVQTAQSVRGKDEVTESTSSFTTAENLPRQTTEESTAAIATATDATENLPLIATPKTLEESKIILRRQIRQRKRSHPATTSRNSEQVPDKTQPRIGFVLHLPSCDRVAVAKWQSAWREQSIDQPFLFQVLLGSPVDKSCLVDIQSDLLARNNNNNNNNNDPMIYQVSQNEHLALMLQTCQSPQNVLQSLQLEQALYYDATKATGRLRSSAVIRRFSAPAVSVFACTGGGQQKPAFCDDSVLECPWFQYSPPTEGAAPAAGAADGPLFMTPKKLDVAVA